MTHHQPILVAVNSSRASATAIRYGVHEAARLRAPLRLVHVIAEFVPMAPLHPLVPCDLEDTGRAILAAAAAEVRTLRSDVDVTTSLIDGPRIPALVQAAREARLMVFGHERHPTVDRLLTGATVTGVAAAAVCPVVAVPPDWTATHEHRRVLVGVKSITESSQLLRRAFETASERKAKLLIVHAWELPGEYDDLITARVDMAEWEGRVRHALDRASASFQDAYPEVPVEIRVVHGQAAFMLRQASDEADLVLLARRSRAFPIGHLGGTSRALLRFSGCPVSVVPPADETDQRLDLVIEREGALLK